jgi:hypothetical protein
MILSRKGGLVLRHADVVVLDSFVAAEAADLGRQRLSSPQGVGVCRGEG